MSTAEIVSNSNDESPCDAHNPARLWRMLHTPNRSNLRGVDAILGKRCVQIGNWVALAGFNLDVPPGGRVIVDEDLGEVRVQRSNHDQREDHQAEHGDSHSGPAPGVARVRDRRAHGQQLGTEYDSKCGDDLQKHIGVLHNQDRRANHHADARDKEHLDIGVVLAKYLFELAIG